MCKHAAVGETSHNPKTVLIAGLRILSAPSLLQACSPNYGTMTGVMGSSSKLIASTRLNAPEKIPVSQGSSQRGGEPPLLSQNSFDVVRKTQKPFNLKTTHLF